MIIANDISITPNSPKRLLQVASELFMLFCVYRNRQYRCTKMEQCVLKIETNKKMKGDDNMAREDLYIREGNILLAR